MLEFTFHSLFSAEIFKLIYPTSSTAGYGLDSLFIYCLYYLLVGYCGTYSYKLCS